MGNAVIAHTPVQDQLLERLDALETMRREMDLTHNGDELKRRLVGRGIYALLRECIDSGVGDEAREILSGAVS